MLSAFLNTLTKKGENMFIQPNKQVGIPLYLQIAEQLKEMILQKELPSGAKMPSERTMASLIDVHRNTIKHAYNELKADRYIETHERKGYFVSDLGEEKVEKGRTYNLRWSDIIKSKYINRRIEEQFSSFFKKDVKYSFAGDIMHTREIGSEDLKRIIKKISSDIDATIHIRQEYFANMMHFRNWDMHVDIASVDQLACWQHCH